MPTEYYSSLHEGYPTGPGFWPKPAPFGQGLIMTKYFAFGRPIRHNFLEEMASPTKAPFDSSLNLSSQRQNLLGAKEKGQYLFGRPRVRPEKLFLSVESRYWCDYRQKEDGLEYSTVRGRRRFTSNDNLDIGHFFNSLLLHYRGK